MPGELLSSHPALKFIRHSHHILHTFRSHPRSNLKLHLNEYLERSDIPEKNEITRVVYGVERKSIALDSILKKKAKNKYPFPAPAQISLQIGLFLLLFSDSYPDYAVVNESVAAAPAYFRPLVNAILRESAAKRESLKRFIQDHPDLSIRFSMPPLIIQQLNGLSDLPLQDLTDLDSEPSFYLRTNPHRISISEAEKKLRDASIPNFFTPELSSWRVDAITPPLRQWIRDGLFFIQNPSSQLVSLIASRYSRHSLFDGAAAPGGKSITTSHLRPDIRITAADTHIGRLRILRQNLADFSPRSPISLLAMDLRKPALRYDGFDLFLFDLPCTSVGTLKKNPDLKQRISDSHVLENSLLQKEIFHATVPFPQDSLLLYSVCSFFKEETIEVIRSLEDVQSFHEIDLSPLLDSLGFRFLRRGPGFFLLSSPLKNDFFYLFLAKMEG